MTLESSAHASRLRVIARAQALRNASQACGEFGISRTLFYRWPRRGRPLTLSVEAERAILSLAYPGASPLEHAAGPARVRGLVGEPQHGVPRVAPGWAGHPPGTPRCPGAPQRRSARLLTERTRRALGKLKEVGKRYQYTACDVASAYAIAQVSTEFSAAAARFLTTRVLPAYQAGLACAPRAHRLGQRVPPALQGTILHELWRVEFRRRFFTPLLQLQAALHRSLEFYNTAGRTSATAPAAEHPPIRSGEL